MRFSAVVGRLGDWIGRMVDDGLLEKTGGEFQPERRRHPRYRPTSMAWRVEVSGDLTEGVLENISIGGACIRFDERTPPPQPGDVISVTFPQPGPDTLRADVVSVSHAESGLMLHLSWSIDQEHAVERVNSLLSHAAG